MFVRWSNLTIGDEEQRRLPGYRDPAAPGEVKVWTPELRATDAPKLTAVIQPLHDSLSTIAQKVATAG